MGPPPSAVIAPSMQTPAQSMLRRPAASAAVIACAASATYCRKCSTLSAGGKFHIRASSRTGAGKLRSGFPVEQAECGEPPRRLPVVLRLKEELRHGQPTYPERSL